MRRPEFNMARIEEAGLDVERIVHTRVLLKIDDVRDDQIRSHPVWPLCRALGAIGFSVQLQGAADFFEAFEAAMSGFAFHQDPGCWTESSVNETPNLDLIIDLTNDLESKALCARLCARRSIPCLSVLPARSGKAADLFIWT